MTLNRPVSKSRPATVLILLFLILFIGVVDNQVVLPILALIAATFQRSASDLAPVITAYAFSAATLNLLFGPLSDHMGRKRILLFGLAGFSMCSYALGLVSAFGPFFLLRALMGMFAGILSTCVTAYVGDYFPYSVRGRAMGVVIDSLACPLLLVTGTLDEQWPAARYRDLWLPADRLTVKGASHWGLVLSRRAIAQAAPGVVGWLEGRRSQRRGAAR